MAKEATIKNATQIIERFGGIRPMAKKMDVAVTTVQGWKKRDAIPGARRQQVLDAATVHDVDLSDIFDDIEIANQNHETREEPSEVAPISAQPKNTPTKDSPAQREKNQNFDQKLAATERRAVNKAVTKSTWISLILFLLAIAGIIALFWPEKTRFTQLSHNVERIDGDVKTLQDKQSFLGMILPENLGAQLEALQKQAGATQEQIGQILSKAQQVSQDVLGENAGTITQRITKLETHVSDLTNTPPVLSGFMNHITSMGANENGAAQLQQVINELGALFEGSAQIQAASGQSAPALEDILSTAREESPAMNSAFGQVPVADLKAAALLLGMSQFRSALNRDNEAFESDLQILENLIGEDDIVLREALARLAPQAKEGVLTPAGLVNEFKSLTGDAVVASLSGEDVSLQERASARMNSVFQIEKDGELITGTETQATLAKTQALLENGNVEEAIATAQGLEGNAAEVIAPWLNQAHATALAQKVRSLLGRSIDLQAYGAAANKNIRSITAGGLPSGTSRLIQNEATGISILKSTKPTIPNIKDANPFDNR